MANLRAKWSQLRCCTCKKEFKQILFTCWSRSCCSSPPTMRLHRFVILCLNSLPLFPTWECQNVVTSDKHSLALFIFQFAALPVRETALTLSFKPCRICSSLKINKNCFKVYFDVQFACLFLKSGAILRPVWMCDLVEQNSQVMRF